MKSTRSHSRYLISVVGPTAVGKTTVAIDLALQYRTEIFSADSRQLFRELEIGTAKPGPSELALVKHHFINSHSIQDPMSAGIYERQALKMLEQVFQAHEIVIMVGGTGLYFDAVWYGIDDMPEIDAETRENLKKRLTNEGVANLLDELRVKDPHYYEAVDKQNPKRIIRALEVIHITGKPYSSFRIRQRPKRTFEVIKIGLQMDRERLFQRIDERMDAMISQGLFEEAEKLYPLKHLNALNTVGYKEIFDFLDGAYEREEAVRLLKRNSRRYAKRQMTWFKRDEEIAWFEPEQVHDILTYLDQRLK